MTVSELVAELTTRFPSDAIVSVIGISRNNPCRTLKLEFGEAIEVVGNGSEAIIKSNMQD